MKPATLILLALAALVGAFFGVREYAPQHLPDQFTTDAVLRERMREYISRESAAGLAFYDKFETLFPADHDELLNQLLALYRRGGTQEQARILSESYMTSFLEDNQRHVAAADPATLVTLGATVRDSLQVLQRENPDICAQYLRDGSTPASIDDLSPAAQAALINVTNAVLDSIAAGRRAPTQYAPPVEPQWLAWLGRYEAAGGDRAVLEKMNDQRIVTLEANEICEAGAQMWAAVLTANDDFAPRFVSASMSR